MITDELIGLMHKDIDSLDGLQEVQRHLDRIAERLNYNKDSYKSNVNDDDK